MNWLIRLLVMVTLAVLQVDIASAQTPVTHSTMTGQDLHQAFHYEQSGDPGNVGAGKWWFRTTDSVLFRRDSANTSWSQVYQAPDGDLTTISGLVCAEGQVIKKVSGVWACGADLTTPASVTITETFALSGDISPPQITLDQTDYNPTGLSTAAVLRVSTDASRNLNTLAGGFDGRLLLIHNIGSFNLVFKNLGTGTTTNQFDINADVTLTPKQVSLLQYDSTSQKWRIIAGAGSGGGQAADNDLTAIAALSGTGIAVRTAADTWAQRQVTGQAGNITVTNPAGIAGNVLVDLGTTAVQTDQSNTYIGGDQNFTSAASFTFPIATGAAPTASGRCAYDSTANRLKCGFIGVTVTLATLAEIQAAFQPLNTNLTQMSGLSPVNNSTYIHNGTSWGLLTRPSCNGAGQALTYDTSNRTEGCVTFSGFISGLTTGKLTKALTATTIGDSIVSESSGVVTVNGGFVIGSGPYVLVDTSAIATTDKTWTVINQSGTIRPSTGVLTPGNIVTTNASGQLIDGGAPGAGTWTDTSTNTGTNKTIDAEGTGNVITIPVHVVFPAAFCDNVTASPGFDLPTSAAPTYACFGTTTTQGALAFVDSSTTGATNHWKLPSDWTGNLDVDLVWFANAASSNAVRWSVATGCVADSEAINTGPSYNTASAVNSSYTGTANQRKTTSFTSVAVTNCAAGETIYLQVQRIGSDAGDTLAATAQLLEASVKIRRAM